jgi:hypothetical protein
MSSNTMVQLPVYLPAGLRKRFKLYSVTQERSMCDLLRDAMERMIREGETDREQVALLERVDAA